jgi:orotate phosphoribosyltransferase
MMTTQTSIPSAVLEMLNGYGCLVFEGEHFVYKSEKHGHAYINVDPMLYQPRAIQSIARKLAASYRPAGPRSTIPIVEVVATPAVGAIPFGQETAIQLDRSYAQTSWMHKPEVLHVFADKTADGGFALERTGFAGACEGKNVLVVEDVLNSGISATGVIDCVRDAGGTVVGVSCAVSRGGLTATDLDVPHFDAVVDINMVQYLAEDCPLCAQKRPIIIDAALGKGQAYQFKHPSYSGGYKTLLV